MNYHFGDYGFEFSERGLGDAMMVTSSVKDENGKYKKIKIDLDPDISLLGFSLIGREKKKSKEAEKLRQFIKENKKQEDKNVINETEEQYKINKEKFLNKQEITEKLNIFNNESTIFKNQINGFLEKRSDFENRKKEIDTWSQEKINANRQEWEDFQEEKKMLDEEYASLLKTEEDFQTRGFYLDSMVGEYTAKESEKGTWAGGIFNSFTRGIGRIAAGGMSLAIDALASIPGIQEPNDSKFIAHAIDKGFITLEKIEQINNSILPTSSTVNIEGTEVIGKRTPEEIDEEEKIRNNKLLNAIKESLSKEQVSSINSLIKDLNKKSLKYNNVEEVDILDSEGNPTGLKVDKVVDTTNPYAQSAKKFLDEDNVGMLKASRDGTTIVFGTDNTTAEWTDLKKQGFWGGAILGLGESIPAMIGGGGIAGWANRTAKMYAQVSDHVMETMEKDSDFDNITENEKLLFTIPLGSVVAGLEAFGLRNIINQKGLLNGILLKAINKTPKGKLAGLTFNQALQREVKSTGLKFMGGAGAAALAEFETGFAQEGADIGFKKLYNAMKEKEMFSTPEGGLDILKQMIRAGGQEAVGGFILGVPNGIQVAFNKYDFTTLEKGQWEMFKEINKTEKSKSQYFSFFVQDIKNKILTKKITKQQGEQILNDFNKVSSLYSQVPTDLSNTQQQQILGLLSRKQDLEQQIQGKDKALVAEQIEEIADINVRMAEVLRAKIETEDEETIEQRLENRDKSLFEDTQEAGGRTSTISDITTKDGVSTGIYSDQDGNADIVISSTGDNQNFVGYYRVYENGKPTNKWTSKMQISDSKQFSNMIEDAQSKLPEGHTWTETTSVSKDGLRVWNKAKEKGYVEVTDADGNVVTTTVTLNQAQKKTDGSKPSYKDVIVRSKEKANAIIKELQKIYPNIKVTKVGPKIKIELPVLQKKSTETLTQEEADIDTFFGENIENNNIDNVSNNLVVNGKDTLSKFQEKIISLAKLSLKAISKIAPDIRMVIHTNEKNYNKSAKQNTNGEYNPNTKIIHINLGRIGSQISKAEKSKDLNQLNSLKAKALTTVPHEIFHAIVVSKTETDLETSKLTKALMSSIRKSLLSNQKLY